MVLQPLLQTAHFAASSHGRCRASHGLTRAGTAQCITWLGGSHGRRCASHGLTRAAHDNCRFTQILVLLSANKPLNLQASSHERAVLATARRVQLLLSVVRRWGGSHERRRASHGPTTCGPRRCFGGTLPTHFYGLITTLNSMRAPTSPPCARERTTLAHDERTHTPTQPDPMNSGPDLHPNRSHSLAKGG